MTTFLIKGALMLSGVVSLALLRRKNGRPEQNVNVEEEEENVKSFYKMIDKLPKKKKEEFNNMVEKLPEKKKENVIKLLAIMPLAKQREIYKFIKLHPVGGFYTILKEKAKEIKAIEWKKPELASITPQIENLTSKTAEKQIMKANPPLQNLAYKIENTKVEPEVAKILQNEEVYDKPTTKYLINKYKLNKKDLFEKIATGYLEKLEKKKLAKNTKPLKHLDNKIKFYKSIEHHYGHKIKELHNLKPETNVSQKTDTGSDEIEKLKKAVAEAEEIYEKEPKKKQVEEITREIPKEIPTSEITREELYKKEPIKHEFIPKSKIFKAYDPISHSEYKAESEDMMTLPHEFYYKIYKKRKAIILEKIENIRKDKKLSEEERNKIRDLIKPENINEKLKEIKELKKKMKYILKFKDKAKRYEEFKQLSLNLLDLIYDVAYIKKMAKLYLTKKERLEIDF